MLIPIACVAAPLTYFALLHLSGRFDPHANGLGYGMAALFSFQLTAIFYSAAQLFIIPLLLFTKRLNKLDLLLLGLRTNIPLLALCTIAGAILFVYPF